MWRWTLIAWLAVVGVPFRADAQLGGFLDRVKDRAQDAAVDSAGKATRKAIEGEPKPKQQKPAEQDSRAQKAAPSSRAGASAEAGTEAAEGDAQAAPGEVYGNRFDFVPGDKVLVYDDFSDTDVGEYPAKWTIKDGGGNPIEVVQVRDRRFLKSRYAEHGQRGATTWLRYPIKGDMPKNFTIEFDTDIAGRLSVLFSHHHGFGGQEIGFWASDEGRQVTSSNVAGKLPVKTGIRHVSIAVSGTQAKVYVGGERVLSDPDAVERPIKRLGMSFNDPYAGEGDHQMFTNLRIAEGGKPAKQMLAGEGRIVTHGILFDTGSDVIKPESGPALRGILALLVEDASLAFTIEGHTDNQGGSKINLPLSQRRAEAVRAWFVKQGIDAGRLAAKGLGDTKPIDANDTAEGRANNRRVEFAKVQASASR